MSSPRYAEREPGIAGLLGLPGRALDSPADNQPDRIDVRHGASAVEQDEGKRLRLGVFDNGVQADGIGLEVLAAAQRLTAALEGHRRGTVCRWGGTNQRRLKELAIHKI